MRITGEAPTRPARHVTLGSHIAVEFLVGVALALTPLIFDLSEGATIAALVLGVAIATVAISTRLVDHNVSAHRAWDRGVVVILLAATVGSAIADLGAATVVFAVAALIEAGLAHLTRYVAERS